MIDDVCVIKDVNVVKEEEGREGKRREVERSVVLETLGFDLKVSLKFLRRSS